VEVHFSESNLVYPSDCDHAIENGCEDHSETRGKYMCACVPGMVIQDRGSEKVTRVASPGKASSVTCVQVRFFQE
jgi:hypothetical protein